jgi:cyanophycinase-like exopeptidase
VSAAGGGAPRLLTIMGSGETSPTMAKTHRELLRRLGPPPVLAVVLDTPFGFQENADELVARAVAYFERSVGHPLELASLRSAHDADPLELETFLERVRRARYVFAGPGSPTYALRHWAATPLPSLLADKLRRGGAVTFASAAALTLGVVTVPVYEIYKVGEAPHWRPGLDLLSLAGFSAAVIPHYDNAEGGTHDTRYCYLGERRLRMLEAELPDDAFVLGVDEHTGLVLDLDAATATVVGLGGVTVRAKGRSVRFESGTTTTVAELVGAARGLVGSAAVSAEAGSQAGGAATPDLDAEDPHARPRASGPPAPPLLEAIEAKEASFGRALAERDPRRAAGALLELDDELAAWSHDSLESDHLEQGRATLRSMVVRLAEVAERGAKDPREVIGPFVETLVELRDRLRRERRYEDADALRERLAALGVELRDTPGGTVWVIAGEQ